MSRKTKPTRSPARRAEPSAAKKTWVLGPLVLVAGVIAVYAPSMANALIYDDTQVIEAQEAPRSAADFARIFAERHFPNLPYYRPVTRLTLLAQKTLHGDDPAPFHLFNAVLMGLAALAAYGLLRRPVFRLDRATALAAAALFALHPLASSCVYPVSSGRETLLPTAWTLLAVYAFLHRGAGWYALAVTAAGAALLSKEQSVVVPALFVAADVLGITPDPPGRNVRSWLARYAPLAAIWGSYFLVRQKLFGGAEYAFGSLTGPILAVVYALQTIVAPFRDLVYEPTPLVWFSPVRSLAAAAAAGAFVWLAVRSRTALEPATRFWLCWFVLALLPTANLVRQEARFDERYVFLASLGILAPAARAAAAAWTGLDARRSTCAAAAVLIAACAAVSIHRAEFFRDDIAFSRQWLKTNPESINAHYNMGYALARQGDAGAAIEHYREVLRIRPDYTLAHNNLGNALAARGETQAAVVEIREALRLDPGYADAHHNLGVVLAGQGKLDEAAREFEAAVRYRPGFAEAHNNLGNALAGQGKDDAAMAEYSEAVRLRPLFAPAHNNLANTLARAGRLQEAVEHYSTALRLQPDYAEARRNLDLVLDRLATSRPK